MNKSVTNLSRAIRLATAGATSPEQLAVVEREVALEVLGSEALARDAEVRPTAFAGNRDMTPFQATAEFAKRLTSGLRRVAVEIGAKAPRAAKYDLRFATPVMFKGAWMARQIADELGMPYGYFVDAAVRYWSEQGGKRVPRVTQLCAPEVIGHVMTLWANASKTNVA